MYEFQGRGNYGGKSTSPDELVAGYEAAPACHHPNRTLGTVSLENLGDYEQAAVISASVESELSDFDVDDLR